MKLGPIVMGCRRCQVAPGEPCVNLFGNAWRHSGSGELRFHVLREEDAGKVSELLCVTGATGMAIKAARTLVYLGEFGDSIQAETVERFARAIVELTGER